MPKITLPTPLRPYADKQGEIDVQGNTVAELLSNLITRYPALNNHLFAEAGKLRSFVNVYVNDEDIRYLEKDATPVTDKDVVSIIPSIAGGVDLDHDEIRRYSRHLIMPEVGMEGQKKLKAASVLLVGTGGLGSPASMYLAAAGIGRIGLVDFDVVDESNLQRQVVHGQSTIGQLKVDSAEARLRDINPHVDVVTHNTLLSSDNALGLLKDYDVIADGTDNFPTRYLVNDACVLLGKPNIYASIFRFEGQLSVFYAKEGPCYRCLYSEPPPPGLVPSCAEGGVLGILPGLVGMMQATEVVKHVLGIGDSMVGRLLLIDALGMKFRELKLRKDPDCVICGKHPTVTQLVDYQQFCGMPANDHEASYREEEPGAWEITPLQLKQRLGTFQLNLIDVREPHEWDICRLEGAKLMPLGQITECIAELDPAAEIVLYCKAGGRSMKALEALREAGFSKLQSLKGGINAWSREVDPKTPLY
ncbi:MAG: molybdopterin-synthase adenylyltransferase MoeB [Myxococcota bacterium]